MLNCNSVFLVGWWYHIFHNFSYKTKFFKHFAKISFNVKVINENSGPPLSDTPCIFYNKWFAKMATNGLLLSYKRIILCWWALSIIWFYKNRLRTPCISKLLKSRPIPVKYELQMYRHYYFIPPTRLSIKHRGKHLVAKYQKIKFSFTPYRKKSGGKELFLSSLILKEKKVPGGNRTFIYRYIYSKDTRWCECALPTFISKSNIVSLNSAVLFSGK